MKGTLLVAKPWSNRAQIVMARVAGCTLFRRQGGEKWVHSGSLKKCQCPDHHPEVHYKSILWDEEAVVARAMHALDEAQRAQAALTRESSEEECLAAIAAVVKAGENVSKAEHDFEEAQKALPERAKSAAKMARDRFGNELTPILEAKRTEAISEHGRRLVAHVKFECAI